MKWELNDEVDEEGSSAAACRFHAMKDEFQHKSDLIYDFPSVEHFQKCICRYVCSSANRKFNRNSMEASSTIISCFKFHVR